MKVRAVIEAPAPCRVSQLRSFLGLVNYFLPNLSSTLVSLHKLLCKYTVPGPGDLKSRKLSKSQPTSCQLVHFDPNWKVILAWDASLWSGSHMHAVPLYRQQFQEAHIVSVL